MVNVFIGEGTLQAPKRKVIAHGSQMEKYVSSPNKEGHGAESSSSFSRKQKSIKQSQLKKASIISKILVEPLEEDASEDRMQKTVCRPQTARKNVIYETADTKLSSNYNTIGGVSNRFINDRKNSTSGLEFQNFTRDPLDVL